MKRRCLALLSAVCLAAISVSCFADETEKDYSYLEDMSVKELKELDAAIHALLGDNVTETDKTDVPSVSKEETYVEPVLMKEEDFFADILQSYSDRNVVSSRYTTAEINTMSGTEQVAYYAECVAAEKDFYEKYKNAVFDDLNIQYLCNQYTTGIQNQLDAPNRIGENGDLTFYNNEWTAGYNKRSYVIVELADYYDVPFPEEAVGSMRSQVEALDSLNEAETRNAQVSHETVKEVQTLLHEIGFRCWNIDGVAGKRTVKAIKRFQEMYGYEIDGMIDDELIEQLKQVKADKGLDTEVETETEG